LSRRAKDYFDQISSQWDTLRKGFYGDEVREAVLNAVQPGPDDTVLDVGAGTGFLTEAAAKVAKKVVALDLSKSMTDEARAKVLGGNVEFKLGSAESIPLDDGSVEVVVGNMILHHCPSPEVAIREMVRVLKPQGRIALSDMQEHSFEWLRAEHADIWLGFEMREVEKMMLDAGIGNTRVQALSSCCSTTETGESIEIPMFLAHGVKGSVQLMKLEN